MENNLINDLILRAHKIYAIQKNKTKIDGYLFFAPLLGHNSPALQQTPPTETHEVEPFLKMIRCNKCLPKMNHQFVGHYKKIF